MAKRPIVFELEMTAPAGVPASFRWQGRRYVVQQILMHWVEAGPWWRSLAAGLAWEFADADDFDVTWHIWRLEAQSQAGSLLGDVVYRESLSSSSAYPWRLIRVLD